MSQAPTPYVPDADFSTLAATPITSAGLPGTELDGEFAEIASILTATQARLAELQRDDGAVRNGVVGFLAMSADVLAAFASIGSNYRGQWSAGQSYVSGDLVISGIDNYPYLCGGPHTSSADFNSDFAAGVWAILGYRPATDDLVVNTFSGTGSQTQFSLTKNPVNENNTQVYVGGVYQKKTTYSIVGTSPAVLTFATAPAAGTANIEVVIGVSAELINNVVTIPDNSVGEAAIINLNVTTGKLADLSVTAGKLAADAVTTAKILDLNVTTGKIAALAVTGDKIAGAAIDSTKLAANAVQTANIQAGAVENAKIGTAAVDAVKLATDAVETAKIKDGAVTAAKIADLAITTGKLNDLSVTAAKLAASAVTAVKIYAGNGTFPIKVQQVTKTDTQTITGGTWTDVASLSLSFTRVNATSKVRVQAMIHAGASNGNYGAYLRISRGGTVVGVPSTAGSRNLATASGESYSGRNAPPIIIDFIDDVSAVSTNPLTYKIQANTAVGVSAYVNRSDYDTDNTDHARSISTITLTELA